MRDLVKMTLAEQIYSILRDDIINQNIKCGEKITLRELQDRFGLSSTPIREAIKRLSQEGLVNHVTNVGAKIVDINEADIREIYDFCSILDVAALRLSLQSEKADDMIRDLMQCIELQRLSLENNDMEGFKQHSDDFHDILFIYANNSRLYDASKKIRSLFTILTNKYQNQRDADTIVYTEHKEILDEIAVRDFDKAALLMENHFRHAKNYLLENIIHGNND